MAFSILAFLGTLPATFVALVPMHQRRSLFITSVLFAVLCPIIWLTIRSEGMWRTDFTTALWVSITMTLVVFSALTVLSREGWRLGAVMMPCLMIMTFIAMVWEFVDHTVETSASSGFVLFHILVSVTTYAVVTTAAGAAVAGALQERALKRKSPTSLTRRLPSISDCDALQVKLLAFGELILGLGLITGIASSWNLNGVLLPIDHKSVFAILSFVIIGVLLLVHWKSGMRGRQAARLLLAAYLLLTLAYPGVKFVTGVLLS